MSVGGCGSAPRRPTMSASASPPARRTDAPPAVPGPALAPGQSLVAAARGRRVAIFGSPRQQARVRRRLTNPIADGAPLTFLVKQRRHGWLRVYLPVRPNGSTGWIRAGAVALAVDDYRVRVDLSQHRIAVWRGRDLLDEEPIGVGRAVTPTPSGRYYIVELLRPPDPRGLYGPYAFGLSAYSPVLTDFAGGSGEIGIHGTNFPQGLGTDISHGCIRMSNAGITRLARLLPLGTPVTIVR